MLLPIRGNKSSKDCMTRILPCKPNTERYCERERMLTPICMDRATVWHIPIERRFYVDTPLRGELILHTNACTHAPLQRRREMPFIHIWCGVSNNIPFVSLAIYRYVQRTAQRRINRPVLDRKPFIRQLQRYPQVMYFLVSLDVI